MSDDETGQPTPADTDSRLMAGVGAGSGGEQSQFPPLLNIEHQELIRAVERVQVSVVANRELLETRLGAQDVLVQTQFSSNARMLDERYATQTKALDAAFLAQQAAMNTAFSAAEKAVNAAVLNAKEAVGKAETANEKRFESVNEFRGQLNDIVTTLISRGEADARFTAIDEKIGSLQRTLDKGGGKEAWGYLVGAVGLVAVVVTMALSLIGR